MPNRLFTNQILEGIMSLIETNLKTSLSLVGIYRGNLAWLPPNEINTMANGIWLNLESPVQLEEVSMPKGLLDTYRIRMIYIRRIDLTTNPLDQKIDDADLIANLVWDNLKPTFSLGGSGNAQILWWLPRTVEYEPAEDSLVAAISADLMAIAIDTELKLRTRIA